MQKRINNEIALRPEEISTLLEFFPSGIVAFDLEMTGLSPILDKIIEIAAVKLLPSGQLESFHTLVNPLITIPEHTIQYHQLTNDMVKDAPTLKKPLKSFIEFYGNFPLVAHNAQFDAGYIIRGHHEFNFPPGLSDIYDSCRFARSLFKKHHVDDKPQDFKLSGLAQFFDIEFTHHQALDDAIACLKIFARCLQKFQLANTKTSLKDMAFLFKLNQFKKGPDYNLPTRLEVLKDYTPKQTPLNIEYKGKNESEGMRPIRPIALLPLPQGLVLFAECLKDKMNKHFLVKRIKKIEVLETTNDDKK